MENLEESGKLLIKEALPVESFPLNSEFVFYCTVVVYIMRKQHFFEASIPLKEILRPLFLVAGYLMQFFFKTNYLCWKIGNLRMYPIKWPPSTQPSFSKFLIYLMHSTTISIFVKHIKRKSSDRVLPQISP